MKIYLIKYGDKYWDGQMFSSYIGPSVYDRGSALINFWESKEQAQERRSYVVDHLGIGKKDFKIVSWSGGRARDYLLRKVVYILMRREVS